MKLGRHGLCTLCFDQSGCKQDDFKGMEQLLVFQYNIEEPYVSSTLRNDTSNLVNFSMKGSIKSP